MNKELKQLAEHALLDSFYTDFSALVNRYILIATRLNDQQLFEIQLQEKANVFSRNEQVDNTRLWPTITTLTFSGDTLYKHHTIFSALKQKKACSITINGECFFRRQNLKNSEWRYVGDKVE